MLPEMTTLYSMEWLSADVLAKSVKPGDLIEFRRTMPYKHWAVCVEVDESPTKRTASDIKVVHLQPQLFGIQGMYAAYLLGHQGRILIQTLSDVHGGKPCRVNNVMDQRYAPLGVAQIIQLAIKKEGSSPYNVTYCNSEHFVNSCRYGRHETLEEYVPPLPIMLFILLVTALLPAPVTLGILTGVFVFILLCICMHKLRQSRRVTLTTPQIVTDPKNAPQPKTIE